MKVTKGEANPRSIVTSLRRAECKSSDVGVFGHLKTQVNVLLDRAHCNTDRGNCDDRIESCVTTAGAKPGLGSSKIGADISPRAIANICCSLPESAPAGFAFPLSTRKNNQCFSRFLLLTYVAINSGGTHETAQPSRDRVADDAGAKAGEFFTPPEVVDTGLLPVSHSHAMPKRSQNSRTFSSDAMALRRATSIAACSSSLST